MRSTIPAPIQAELDAAIARGASEEEQAIIWAQARPTQVEGVMPSGRPWPTLTNRHRLAKAEVSEYLTRYRRWQLEEATAPEVLKRSMALLYGPEKE